jgi:tetratricopeptide (TPR) repeat protein
MILLLLCPVALPRSAAGADAALVLNFENDSAELTTRAQEKLSAYMKGVQLGKRGKVLVVGHADEKGEHKHNLALSRKRAGGVKKALVDGLAIPAERVLTVGQGNSAPIAANDTNQGRAQNRRATVRLVGVAPPEIQRRYGGQDPRLVEVDALLSKADAKIRQGRYTTALADLDQAAKLGGDQYSQWHTSYGILGYLGGQPPHKLRGYFEMALALNPHDGDARDFLGRIDAREAFLEGRVVPYMGRTPRSAIKVTSRSQEYEYLQLFEVEPLSHHSLAQGTIDVWTCRAGKNRMVTYYFDTRPVLAWAYPGEPVSQ